MKTYKIVLAYDGTDFKGWQRQPADRTVQGTVEAALLRITGKTVAVTASGRTDAGVHALAQVAGFRGRISLDEVTLLRALNAVLPPDVRILSLETAPPGFHPRRSARSKTYIYRIVTAPVISPFDYRYALHWPHRLNVAAMRRAAALFVREGDFSAFSSNRDRRPVRRITRSEIRRRGDELIYTVEGRGFLRYMVRTMVGTLLDVGRGRYPAERLEEAFRTGDRSLAGPTVPALGLCLVRVIYEDASSGSIEKPIT